MNILYARRLFAGAAVATSKKDNAAYENSSMNKVQLITKHYTSLYHMPIKNANCLSLTDDETAQINGLDCGEKHDWY